jgi:hypothetical protein
MDFEKSSEILEIHAKHGTVNAQDGLGLWQIESINEDGFLNSGQSCGLSSAAGL